MHWFCTQIETEQQRIGTAGIQQKNQTHQTSRLTYLFVKSSGISWCAFWLRGAGGNHLPTLVECMPAKAVLVSWKCRESSFKGRPPCRPVGHAHRPGSTTCRGQGVSGFSLPLASALQGVTALGASCFHDYSRVLSKSPNDLAGRPFCSEDPSASMPLHFSLQISFS